MTIYHDSTYDGWSDQVDAGEIGEYMVGATQRHDLPGGMTPSAPYSAGHDPRSHLFERWEERLAFSVGGPTCGSAAARPVDRECGGSIP